MGVMDRFLGAGAAVTSVANAATGVAEVEASTSKPSGAFCASRYAPFIPSACGSS